MDSHRSRDHGRPFDRRTLARRATALGLSAAAGGLVGHGSAAAQGGTPTPPPDPAGSPPPAAGTALDGVVAHHTADVNGLRMHYVTAGQGDPVVLLHGAFETWYEWRNVIPALAERYTVVAPDLRGAGDSARPTGGYDKRTMAEDVYGLVRQLGFERVFLVGHDIGLMVAYAFAGAYPEAVRRLAVLDAPLPGIDPFAQLAPERWHFAFFAVPDLPEALVAGQERLFMSWFYRNFAYDPSAVDADMVDEYVRTYAAEGGIRALAAWFRAFPQDAAANQELARTRLTMPVLALGGELGVGEVVLATMRGVADDVRGEVLARCGHWIAAEQPDELVARLLGFFAEGA